MRALELKPGNAESLYYLGGLLDDENIDLERAEKYYRQALEQGENAGTLCDLGSLLGAKKGLHDEATLMYRRALKLDPRMPNTGGVS